MLLNLAAVATTCPVRAGAGSVIIRSGRGGLGIDVVIRVEQDHCFGAHGDDCRDGVWNTGGPTRPPEGAREAGLYRRGGGADRERPGDGGSGGQPRADWATARQGLPDLPYLQQGRAEQNWPQPLGRYRGADRQRPWVPVLRGIGERQERQVGRGKAE